MDGKYSKDYQGKGKTHKHTTLIVQGKALRMEIDTGASVSIVSEATWKSSYVELRSGTFETHRRSRHTGESVPVRGKLRVTVDTPDGRQLSLPLVVGSGSGPSLLGRDCMASANTDRFGKDSPHGNWVRSGGCVRFAQLLYRCG